MRQKYFSRYEFSADTLGDDRDNGLPDWPLHMAEKEWVNIRLFLEAFEHALETHKGKYEENFRPDWRAALRKQLGL
jgi:hypothetical protein